MDTDDQNTYESFGRAFRRILHELRESMTRYHIAEGFLVADEKSGTFVESTPEMLQVPPNVFEGLEDVVNEINASYGWTTNQN